MKEESKYYYTDIETGRRTPCTKEVLDRMNKAWEVCRPKNIKTPGSIVIFGTAGEVEATESLEKLFRDGK